MSASKPTLTKAQMKQYDRLMLRSSFESLLWTVIVDLKKRRGYRLQELADAIGVDKSGVSRWFSGNTPNWTLNTIADIANALNVDLRVEAVDRVTSTVYTSHGETRDPGETGDVRADREIRSRESNAQKMDAPSEHSRTRHTRTMQSRKGSQIG
jgi:transcriptional regulator with XRE-family HTH domain